jgi:hypothetical protein
MMKEAAQVATQLDEVLIIILSHFILNFVVVAPEEVFTAIFTTFTVLAYRTSSYLWCHHVAVVILIRGALSVIMSRIGIITTLPLHPA